MPLRRTKLARVGSLLKLFGIVDELRRGPDCTPLVLLSLPCWQGEFISYTQTRLTPRRLKPLLSLEYVPLTLIFQLYNPIMRLSKLPITTLKEVPAEAEVITHQLMLRAGLIRRLSSGLFTWMPLALKVLRKVQQRLPRFPQWPPAPSHICHRDSQARDATRCLTPAWLQLVGS